jgi:hypothetical protein
MQFAQEELCCVQLVGWKEGNGRCVAEGTGPSAVCKVREKNLHGLSPRANYTDRATAACWRSDCQLLRDRGCHVVSLTDPYGHILRFLDRSRYFSIK